MFSKEGIAACKEKISNAKKIAIFSHENVDGDAVGSLLGLGAICEKLGKEVGLFTTVKPGRSYDFLPDISKIRTDFDYSDAWDLIIFVDFTGYKRINKITEGHEEYFNAKEKIIIDHHIGDDVFEPVVVLKDVDASSCCELLYEISKEIWPELIDAQIATYWYLGITTDTGNFQYEKDSVRTMNNAMGLIKLGVNKPWVLQHVFNNSDRSSIDLSKMMIPRITRDKHICYAYYNTEEIEKMGFDKDEADSLILSYLRPLKALPVIVIIRKEVNNNKVGMSFRSGYMADGRRIDVQKIAVHFNGGGHMYAAGCKAPLEDDFLTQVPKLAAEINVEIEKQL